MLHLAAAHIAPLPCPSLPFLSSSFFLRPLYLSSRIQMMICRDAFTYRISSTPDFLDLNSHIPPRRPSVTTSLPGCQNGANDYIHTPHRHGAIAAARIETYA